MEYISPWSTEIGRFNIADRCDLALLSEEIFTLYSMTQGEDDSQSIILPGIFPEIIRTRNEIITPAVQEYSLRCFSTYLVNAYVETNGKWIPETTGLHPHYHPGSVISAVFYPTDSNDPMVMFDPRGNACRGYPKPMRHAHFVPYQVVPKAGDVIVFPSYLQHSVPHVHEETRLSLLHEYYCTEQL